VYNAANVIGGNKRAEPTIYKDPMPSRRWVFFVVENDMNIWFFLAAACFALAAFNVPRLNWTAAGFCLVTVGLWLA
jgi:hypothetical protein